MKVLIIAHDVGSKEMGMLFRPYHIAQGLKSRGHEVEIITASYSRVRRVNPSIENDLECSQVEGIKYHWLKSLKFSGNSLQRALGMFLFSFKLWWYSSYFAKILKADAVIASSPHPFIIWGAHKIARKAGGNLFFEVRDIWPLSMGEIGGMHKKHPFYILCQMAEDYAYKNSKKVISLLPYAFEHMESRGLKKEKFVFIPNGFDDDFIKNRQSLAPELQTDLAHFKEKHCCLVGYVGAHGAANSLESIITAFSLIPKESKIGLVLVGDGSEKKMLISKAEKLGLDNILFLNPVSKYQIPSVLDFIDIAYIGLKKSTVFKFGVSPNKLIDYMAMGKPILYAIDTERDPVSESNCGYKVPSDQPDGLAKAIIDVCSKPIDELHSKGQKGKDWVEKNISYSVLLTRMEDTLAGKHLT
ncbi:glycosyltransferase family 4 protein [Bdellovibrio reynosensis]|uniref:Glycosyltransferase family 4 protein n=1 Tax=Bdellovibrio reynosensis TaxID=2835041 RepID=A0ABY4CJ14_9BACT|nr:glycosyltransferase family 4 protein [Bdellovibrio reynosensis]UOF02230.1 glycosyltransferase family 4 protein [Bdellovibrio reynosensis]